MCKKVGIEVWGSFILGLPTETIEDSWASINQAIKLDIDYVQFPICTPFPGTELNELCKKDGKMLTDNSSIYTTWDKIVYTPGERTVEEIKKTVKQAYRKFYLRPGFIFRKTWNLRKLPMKNIYNLMRAGMNTFFG